jgi:predicted phosphoadenosine phosphosulfate sulfurtransferase
MTSMGDGVWSAYPIYDWAVDDVWTANFKFGFDYNRLYDLFFEAGVPVAAMRVASPFNDQAIGTLALYRSIEPSIWARMVGRVNGANFASIYGGTDAVGWKNVKLPKGHTWRSYVEFLLKSLPTEMRRNYEEKFATSLQFWRDKGGVLSDETIEELRAMGIAIEVKGATGYKTTKMPVTFAEYPDDLDVKDFMAVPTYKRMAICVMKNDHLCKTMGLSQTKQETERRRAAIAKYMDL